MDAVSVIIPSYNRRELTARAVLSVIRQSYQDLEVIVVDDHSRDEEVYSPDESVRDRVTVIRQRENGGVAAARNAGVACAKGPLVAFLDSDDYWLPGCLERRVVALAHAPSGNDVLVYASYYTTDTIHWMRTARVAARPGQTIVDYLLVNDGDMHVNTWLARKTMLERFPFDERLSQSEDWDALLRMYESGVCFAHSPEAAAVRHVDLREDRLSTVSSDVMRALFLKKNTPRLSLRDALVLEAALTCYRKSSLRNLADKIGLFLSSPRLAPHRRIELVFDYVPNRIAAKIRDRMERLKPAPSFDHRGSAGVSSKIEHARHDGA